jgi:D-psicose/D-tagatose/L-ribulose 3-epimerase
MNNQLGIHALVLEREWDTDAAVRAVRTAAALGYDLIELPMFEPWQLNLVAVRQALDETGLAVNCSLGLPFNADISSANPEIAAAGERLLLDVVHAAGMLRADLVAGVIHSAMGKHPGPSTPANWEAASVGLRRVADAAGSLGMRLGLEVVNRYESNLVNTAATGVALVTAIGRENVVVHLDTYHMNIEERGPFEAVGDCAGKLGYVHVGESSRGYLGSGSVDLTGLVRALYQVGYTGAITFEAFSSSRVTPALAATLSLWRDVWDDPVDLATHALACLRTALRAAEPGVIAGGVPPVGQVVSGTGPCDLVAGQTG